MSDLQDQVDIMNILLGLELELTYCDDPVLVKTKGSVLVDYTRPWLMVQGEEIVINRASYTTVRGFLSALNWIATQRYIYEEPK